MDTLRKRPNRARIDSAKSTRSRNIVMAKFQKLHRGNGALNLINNLHVQGLLFRFYKARTALCPFVRTCDKQASGLN